MFQKLFTRRRAVAVATVALGMSGMSLAFAGTAGAADPNPSSTLIVGSGSNTAYCPDGGTRGTCSTPPPAVT